MIQSHIRGAAILALALLTGCGGASPGSTQGYDSVARLRVAAAAEASGQTDIALSMRASAAAADPARGDIQAGFAAALLRSGNTAQAETVLSRALERQPTDPALLVAAGRLHLRSGDAERALTMFDSVLARAPRNAGALGGRGVALDLLGRHGEAEQSHRAAVGSDPANIAAANNLAMSLLLADRAREAAAILAPLARRPNAPPRVAANLAVAQAASSGDAAEPRAARDMVSAVLEPR